MSEYLVLFGGDGPDAPLAWARTDSEGAVLSQGLIEGAATPPSSAPGRTVLILPGAEARLKRLDLPARTEAQARAGAPFLFEGALADDSATHFAVGAAQNAEGSRLVAAMSAQRLHQWLERCRSFGADPHHVVLDCTVWPVAANAVAIAVLPKRVIVAGGVQGGFAIEPALAPAVFSRWLSELAAPPAQLTLYGGEEAAWRQAAGRLGSKLETQPAADPIAVLAAGAIGGGAIAPNLRQGEFAVAGKTAQPLRLWRFAALLAAAALLLHVGSLVIAGIRDRQAAAQMLATAERDYRGLHPEGVRIVNLRAQVAAETNRMAQAGRHPVLTVAAPVVEALRAQPSARIDEVHHRGPARTVRLLLSASEPAALTSTLDALRAAGLRLESRDTAPREGRYAVELDIEAPL